MPTNNETYPDRDSYEEFWDKIIFPVATAYKERYSGINIDSFAKEKVWKEYFSFNQLCKMFYMEDPSGLLDRHKVCACYIYAIVKAKVLNCSYTMSVSENQFIAINEQLAITCGMSLLRAYIEAGIRSDNELNENDRQKKLDKITGNIRFPKTNHGNYRDNFASELYFTRENGQYNILSLANILFLLETLSLS